MEDSNRIKEHRRKVREGMRNWNNKVKMANKERSARGNNERLNNRSESINRILARHAEYERKRKANISRIEGNQKSKIGIHLSYPSQPSQPSQSTPSRLSRQSVSNPNEIKKRKTKLKQNRLENINKNNMRFSRQRGKTNLQKRFGELN